MLDSPQQRESELNEEEKKGDSRDPAEGVPLPKDRPTDYRPGANHQQESGIEESKDEVVIDIREPIERQQLQESRQSQTSIQGRKSPRYTAEDFMHEAFPASEKIKLGIAGLISIALIISIGPIGMLLGLIGIAYCGFKYSDAKKEAALKAKEENITIENNDKAAKRAQEKDALATQMQSMQQAYQQQFEQTSRLLQIITQRVQTQPYPYMAGTAYAQPGFGGPPQPPHMVMSREAHDQMRSSSLHLSSRSSSVSSDRR